LSSSVSRAVSISTGTPWPASRKRLAQVQAIQARQAQVEHDHVEIAGARAFQARCPIRAMVHLVAATLEEIPDVGGDVRLVLRRGGRAGHRAGRHSCGKGATCAASRINEWLSLS
jgi:hypothetical protein